jgi:transposase-like protein
MSLLLFKQSFPDEASCIAYLELQRWGKDGKHRYCPHCGSYTTYKFKDGKLYKCADCRKQFTVKVGTIFSDSHIPLWKWFYAVYLNTSLKKGISSVQLAKHLELTQKSAWFMLQRIRYSMETSGNGSLLSGTVEVDETYIGGHKRGGKGYQDKAPVFGAVERGGQVKMKHVKSTGARVLLPEIAKNIQPGTTIYSDQAWVYSTLNRRGYEHESVNHALGEFGRGEVHTNTIEGGIWSHFKKSLEAIYMSAVSVKHLQKYCAEFEFRYNTRELKDFERFEKWFGTVNKKRLMYRELVR